MAKALEANLREFWKRLQHPIELLEILTAIDQIDIAMPARFTQAQKLFCPSSEKVAGDTGLAESFDYRSELCTGVFHIASREPAKDSLASLL